MRLNHFFVPAPTLSRCTPISCWTPMPVSEFHAVVQHEARGAVEAHAIDVVAVAPADEPSRRRRRTAAAAEPSRRRGRIATADVQSIDERAAGAAGAAGAGGAAGAALAGAARTAAAFGAHHN